MKLFWFFISFVNTELCLDEINVSQEQGLKTRPILSGEFPCHPRLQGRVLHGKLKVERGFLRDSF